MNITIGHCIHLNVYISELCLVTCPNIYRCISQNCRAPTVAVWQPTCHWWCHQRTYVKLANFNCYHFVISSYCSAILLHFTFVKFSFDTGVESPKYPTSELIRRKNAGLPLEDDEDKGALPRGKNTWPGEEIPAMHYWLTKVFTKF